MTGPPMPISGPAQRLGPGPEGALLPSRMPSAEAIIAAAPRQACEACGFDRAVLYRLRGNELLAESFWVNGDPLAASPLAFSREHPAELAVEGSGDRHDPGP